MRLFSLKCCVLCFVLLIVNQVDSKDADVETLLSMQTNEWVLQIKDVYQQNPERFDVLAGVIAENISKTEPVLDALKQETFITGQTLYAELLVRCARGIEVASWNRVGRELDELTVEEIGSRAIALFDHPDPFIRALAEWAIDIRVGMLNGSRTEIWPMGDTPPAWYKQWQNALTADFKLHADYARQCIGLNQHTSVRALYQSARAVQDRVSRMVAALQLDNADQLERILAAMQTETDLTAQRRLWLQTRLAARDIVLANPAIDFDDILFATRHAYHDGPNITAGAKSYIIKPGGDLLVKSGFHPGDPVKPLINGKLAPGHSRGHELWWDADKIVFAYSEQPDYFEGVMWESDQGFDDKEHGFSEPVHLYEINIDGSGLRQLTDHPFYSDVEPAYLPNGDIVFCSERSGYGSQCSGHFFQNKRIVNLYSMKPDGSNIRAISNNKDFDRYPHVLDTGQIIFTRWEYQERHLWQVHNVWVRHPDGSMSDPIFKEHINSGPMALRDARHIPNSHKLIATACGHHEFAQGAIMLMDPHVGTNDIGGMNLVTPGVSPREGGLGKGKPVPQGAVQDDGGLYQQPYALSENAFLVSYSYHLPRQDKNAYNFGLYYIDVWGNKELIHRDPVLSSVYPIPVKKRPRPRVIPDKLQPEKNVATVYMNDIFSGVPDFDPGEAKYIRIAHHTEWPTQQTGDQVVDFNHLHYTPSGSWARTVGLWTWTPARVIGEVPVEEDGSAHFKVPANVPLYFQALDENHMELRRMRTFITFQPGEVRGCTGCHESRDEAPITVDRVPQAVRCTPSMPVPPSWGEQVLPDYEEHIQPMIAKHCEGCHGAQDPAAGLEFSSRKIEGQYQSYRTMFGLDADDRTPVWEPWSHKIINPDNPNPVQDKKALRQMENNEYPGQLLFISNRFGDISVSQVKEFGSNASKLTLTLAHDPLHQENVNMSEQEWIDFVTWVDLNAPYWGSFVNKEPMRRDEPPIRVKFKFPKPFVLNQE